MAKNPLPPPPNMKEKEQENSENTEVAISKAIDKFSDPSNDALMMLSHISDHDVSRLALLLSIANDKELNLDEGIINGNKINDANFLREYVLSELKLTNSVPMKRGGIRSEQMKEIAKRPDNILQNEGGMLSRIKRRF